MKLNHAASESEPAKADAKQTIGIGSGALLGGFKEVIVESMKNTYKPASLPVVLPDLLLVSVPEEDCLSPFQCLTYGAERLIELTPEEVIYAALVMPLKIVTEQSQPSFDSIHGHP